MAIMKALGQTNLQLTTQYVSLGRSHIREQVEKLNEMHLPSTMGLIQKPKVA
jgi:hypothetical protein